MIYAMDYLGGAKFKDVILKEHPDGWGAGCFAQAFSDALPIIDQLLATGRCPHLRVHLCWDDNHRYGDQNIPAIKKEAARYEKLHQKYPNITFELSPCCEHELKNPYKYLDIVKQYAPTCIPVNSPDSKGSMSTKYKNEVHGNNAKSPRKGAFNFSFDGNSSYDSDVESIKARLSGADIFFFWGANFNGKTKDTDTTPRPNRRAWPSSSYIDSIIYQKDPCGAVSLPNNWTYKTHSEKGYKPVFIIPIRANQILIKARNGQIIDTLKYYGTFVDGRFRYYSTNWGYQSADKAKRIQGDPLVEVWVNGKKYGIINQAFRSGDFR